MQERNSPSALEKLSKVAISGSVLFTIGSIAYVIGGWNAYKDYVNDIPGVSKAAFCSYVVASVACATTAYSFFRQALRSSR